MPLHRLNLLWIGGRLTSSAFPSPTPFPEGHTRFTAGGVLLRGALAMALAGSVVYLRPCFRSRNAPPERTAALIAAALAATLGACAALYVLVRRRKSRPAKWGCCFSRSLSVDCAVDLYHVAAQVTFPGDFLSGPKAISSMIFRNFVLAIIYSDQSNNDSF